jgi:hypothetical protein
VGDERFLSVASQQLPEDGEGASDKPALNRSQRHRAQQVYDFCQLEGGRFWDYSKGELEDLVASGQPWPEDLREMVERRYSWTGSCGVASDGVGRAQGWRLLGSWLRSWVPAGRVHPCTRAAAAAVWCWLSAGLAGWAARGFQRFLPSGLQYVQACKGNFAWWVVA